MPNNKFNDIINPFFDLEDDVKKLIGYESIKTAGDTTKDFIKQLREGDISFIKTGIPALDESLDGGIMPNTIFTLGGLSGSGKSAFEDSLVMGILENNPDRDITAVHFNYEMLTKSRMLRKVTSSLGVKRGQMINKNHIPDENMDEIIDEIEKYKDYPIHYINNAVNHKAFLAVWERCKRNLPPSHTVILSIDHLGLSEKLDKYENDLKMLENFAKTFNKIKKEGELETNPNVIIIPLTQLNREIESDSRLNNPSGHAPRSTDLRGGDDIRNISDYVCILHKPAKMDYRQDAYTKANLPIEGHIYLHGVKYREGCEFVIQFIDELEYSKFSKGEIMYQGSRVPNTPNFIPVDTKAPPLYLDDDDDDDLPDSSENQAFMNVKGSLADDNLKDNNELPF